LLASLLFKLIINLISW